MAAPKVTSSATELDAAEREFVETMDALQEYLQLQARLQDQLKKGLMNLARAKYSMGPIGQAQYDMEMQASVRVAIKSGDENGGSSGGGGGAVEGANAPCSGTRYSFEIRKSPNAATARRPSPPPAAAAATMDRAKAAAEATPAAAAAVAEARGSKNVADEGSSSG
ncbi:hypothetical protein Vretimale_12802 [Volvox reticuliferus]|nr:hypothetical protein Vretimale_12802 [Volvox reticuliferus]